MTLKWLQHACFLITDDNGTRILTDPPGEYTGYKPGLTAADIVTVSHQHKDHSNTKMVTGSFVVLDKPGEYFFKDINIKGVSTFHDNLEGAKRGKNIIFIFELDGLRICHCGDLGHQLSQKQLEEIGEIDILLVPVGSIYTIDYSGARNVMKAVNPKVTIPMHFKTEALTFELDTPEKFIAETGAQKLDCDEINISKDNLGNIPSTILLNYK